MSFHFLLACMIVAAVSDRLLADDALPPASERFAGTDAAESPDFQRHIVPLLGRLGCNGRACHGSFQGRGGFRLSLFGYDFKMDHDALTARAESERGARIDRSAAQNSLIIRKPTLEIEHEGGRRFDPGSWEHHLLQRWIAEGANGLEQPQEIDRLEISPAEVVFTDASTPVQLQVVAVWANGVREDVTPLCRFRTNDDAVVTVDREGVLQSAGAGDTHVIAFYDNGVAAVPVMRPVPGRTDSSSGSSADDASPIDQFINSKLSKLGITSSDRCTDAEFLRRVSIDLTGTLPTPDEVTSFLSDSSADKRDRKIDELLARDAYAAWWANKLCDFTGCNPAQQAELGQETSVQWYMWIYTRLQKNMPYDQLIEHIALAKGRGDGQSYDDYTQELTSAYHDETAGRFVAREDMPHYWSRRTLEKSEDKALAFAHSFLGIRMQCAQCHKHPFAPWTQTDFEQFSAFFDSVKFGVVPDAQQRYRELARQVGLQVRGDDGSPVRNDVLRRSAGGRTIPWREVYIAERETPVTLNLLRSGPVQLGTEDDPRQSIMAWMKQPDNPWFARAFVNRVWAGYFNVGIVEPPDDLNPANPPSHPKLLDWLAKSFVDNDYDMKWLHREIVRSDTYQRSWRPTASNREDTRNFSRAVPRRIPAEVVYDGLKQVTAASDQLDEVRTDLTRRAIGHLSMRLAGTYAMHVFGKPERAVNCDCERLNQPTLLQSVFLQNDPLVEQRLKESGWLADIRRRQEAEQGIDASEFVETAWLRTLNRRPSAEESDRAMRHLQNSDSIPDGMEDLLWSLINTKEFVLNH